MQWRGRDGSKNIEDRRGSGGGGRGPVRAGGVGGLGLVAVVVIALLLGVDPAQLLNGTQTGGSAPEQEMTAADAEAGDFVAVVLGYTEQVWAKTFRAQLNRTYAPVTLVLYKGVTGSPCGGASGATGPFYCPGDRKIYLDTAFFTTMEQELGAGGDFAMAYVVAHEVAHHVQDELGILGKANEIRARVGAEESNAISVRIELQADCLSGVWAKAVAGEIGAIEPGDFKEALRAAHQIGDDTLQANAGRVPMPHTFTHGTSEQRSSWFSRGLKTGRMDSCDTFAADQL